MRLQLSRQSQAVIELSLAGALWGFGFVATYWSLAVGAPFTITGWRFVLAGSIGLLTFLLVNKARGRNVLRGEFVRYLRAACGPGILIATLLILQTWGLKYTTATKSGFITCLYVLLVPLLEPLVGGPKPNRAVLLSAAGSLLGVAMMCGLFNGILGGLSATQELDARSRLNVGDFLTLIAAFAASFHILAIDRIGTRLGANFDSFQFNTAQSFMAGLPALAIALAVEPDSANYLARLLDPTISSLGWKTLIGFTSLTIGSTLIAFALQVRAQKQVPAATASLLFLLESPFAALFAAIFLGEVTTPIQLLGGAIILTSVGFATTSIAQRH